MNGNLIDTNVIIKLLNGNSEVAEIFDSLEDIFISSITVGELFYGASKSSRVQENISLFKSFLSEYTVLELTEQTGVIYGNLKFQLFKNGINLPENDIWIASTAIQHNLRLFTYDEHFHHVPNLELHTK